MVNLLIGCLYCMSKTRPPPHHIPALLTLRFRIRCTFCNLMNGSLRLFLHTENHEESTRYQLTMPNQFKEISTMTSLMCDFHIYILRFNERFMYCISSYILRIIRTVLGINLQCGCELQEQYAISTQYSSRIKRKRVFALVVLVLLTLNYTSEC